MIIRNLTSDGDFSFGKGSNDYLRNDAAIGLNIKTRVKSWLNDCFFDQTAGIDWSNRLGSKKQEALLEQDLRRIILQSFGVTSIINFVTITVDRNFRIEYNITTIFSPSFQNSIEIGF